MDLRFRLPVKPNVDIPQKYPLIGVGGRGPGLGTGGRYDNLYKHL